MRFLWWPRVAHVNLYGSAIIIVTQCVAMVKYAIDSVRPRIGKFAYQLPGVV